MIPCFKDIDAYDIPKEFKHLQAQDMGKVGAISDLLRGINKILGYGTKKSKSTEDSFSESDSVLPFIKRVNNFLEDRDWQNAEKYSEKILNKDPENAYGYLGKLMAQLHVSKVNDLYLVGLSLETNNNVKWILRYGDSDMNRCIQNAIDKAKRIDEANIIAEENRKSRIIDNAVKSMNNNSIEDSIRNYVDLFGVIPWGNSKEISEKLDIYIRNELKSLFERGEVDKLKNIKLMISSDNNQVYHDYIELIDEYLAYYDYETYVEFSCPYCSEILSLSLAALKNNESIDCPFCMRKVSLK